MRIVEVANKKTRKAFHNAARLIYKDDDTWVCPLDKEIESIFDPTFNSFFKHGEATRWVLFDDNNNLTGRVAAFIDEKMAFKQ